MGLERRPVASGRPAALECEMRPRSAQESSRPGAQARGREEAGTMKVTIIGAGNMARGIGTRLVAGGNALTILARDPGDAETLAGELNGARPQAAHGAR